MAMGLVKVDSWAGRIFEARETTIEKACYQCSRTMHLPPSKVSRGFCSRDCQNAYRQSVAQSRSRKCATCGAHFLPANAASTFCSQKCNTKSRAALASNESKEKAVANRRAAFAEGKFTLARGEQKPNWNGGPKARVQRYTKSGAAAAALRARRKANPDKVREYANKRSSRKRSTGRLPRGTIQQILTMQKSKCAVCRCKLGHGYHVDHIVPLAKDGKHEPRNLQLLCPPCNLSKSAKDPIDFMQSMGRLL